MTKCNVPVQSLIGHIKTAVDVDDWAKEMAEDLLEKHEPKPVNIVRNKYGIKLCLCPGCGGNFNHEYFKGVIYCENCGQAVKW